MAAPMALPAAMGRGLGALIAPGSRMPLEGTKGVMAGAGAGVDAVPMLADEAPLSDASLLTVPLFGASPLATAPLSTAGPMLLLLEEPSDAGAAEAG